MENSTKALLIAGAILIALILIAVSVKIFSSPKDVVEQSQGVGGTITDSVGDASQYLLSTFDKHTVGGGTGSGSTGGDEDIPWGDGGTTGGNIDNNRVYISKDESYVGYYADIDADGTVDGIIYADLAIGGSGSWNGASYNYSKVSESNLKNYYKIEKHYPAPNDAKTFGYKDVLATDNTGGQQERFYVMSLTDFIPGRYTWYKTKLGSLPKNETSTDFGKGLENTKKMIRKWNEDTNTNKKADDLWGLIQEQANLGWFVPSREEWLAFADVFKIDRSNYSSYGLDLVYWSSSIRDNHYVHWIGFSGIEAGYETEAGYSSSTYWIRLSTIF